MTDDSLKSGTNAGKLRSLREALQLWTPAEAEEMGARLGKQLKAFHAASHGVKRGNSWAKDFSTDIDYLRYRHGLLPQTGWKDYELLDFIQAQRHVLPRVQEKIILFAVSPDTIYITGEGLFATPDPSCARTGDPIFDLVLLNVVGLRHPDFSRGVLHGYFTEAPSRAVFRLLGLYTAVLTLKRLVEQREAEAMLQSAPEAAQQLRAQAPDPLAEILVLYDHFSSFVPIWATDEAERGKYAQ